MIQPVVILGSSRSDGRTREKVNTLTDQLNCPVIDLNDYTISYYDYEHANLKDDFIELMETLINQYDTLIFATPVYWYSMSGVMKVFFDRLTDLLTIKKELGRQLRGKNMAALSNSNGNNLGEAFWLPFSETAHYLGMNYLGNCHCIEHRDNTPELNQFAKLFTN